jgi:hypothetical protein
MKKLSQEELTHLKKVASTSEKSYEVVFEGMRKVAEKLEEMDPATADSHLLSVIKAAANLMVDGGTFSALGKEVLASLDEYKSFLEKYHADKGGINEEGRDISGDMPEMMPDSLFNALDEYSKGDKMKASANTISKSLKKKAQ